MRSGLVGGLLLGLAQITGCSDSSSSADQPAGDTAGSGQGGVGFGGGAGSAGRAGSGATGGSTSTGGAGGTLANAGAAATQATGHAGTGGSAGSASDAGGQAGAPVGAGGSAIGTGGASGGTGALASCEGLPLGDDVVVDFDLRAVHVSGKLLLNGAPMPPDSAARGFLEFAEVTTGFGVTFDLRTNFEDYTTTLPPGTYDVRYVGNQACVADAVMPCGTGVVLEGVELTDDATLDVDVPAVTLRGAITLEGEPLPDASMERGQVWLFNDVFDMYTTLDASGPGEYSMLVLPGTYDVRFVGPYELCAADNSTGIPCNSAIVKPGATVDGSPLDLDLEAVTISGSVTLDGSTPPDAADVRGALTFVPEDDAWWATTRLFDATGPATYEITLFAGVYEVLYAGNSSLCNLEGPATALPCNQGKIASAVELTQSGVHDFDVEPVTLSGNLTLAGGDFPAALGTPLEIQLAPDENLIFPARFNVKGGKTAYAVTLLPGDYQLRYLANFGICGKAPALGLPCINGLLGDLSLDSDRSLDIDVPGIHVTGNVTVNGAPIPDDGSPRGNLVFFREDGSSLSAAFQPTGAARYDVSLLEGVYRIEFTGSSWPCTGGTTASVPCIGGVVRDGVELTADGALDLDIPMRRVSGRVTLDGNRLPDESVTRGGLYFSNVKGFMPGEVDLGSTGEATYGVTLIPGKFTIMHDANPSLCFDGHTSRLPCASQLVAGCETLGLGPVE